MQTQTNFALVKLILNFFSGDPKLPSIPYVGPYPNIKNLFLRLSELDDKLLSTPKIIKFLAKSYKSTIYIPFFITISYYISCSK